MAAVRETLLAEAAAAGDDGAGAIWAGQASGLIHGIEPAGEIVRCVVTEAEDVLRGRAASLLR